MASVSPYKLVNPTSPVNHFVCKLCGEYWAGRLEETPPTQCKSCGGSIDEVRDVAGWIKFCKKRIAIAHEKAAVFDSWPKTHPDPRSFWVGYAAALEDVLITCEE